MKLRDLEAELKAEEERQRIWRESDPGAKLASAVYGAKFTSNDVYSLRVLGDISVLIAEGIHRREGQIGTIEWYRQARAAYNSAMVASAQTEPRINRLEQYLTEKIQIVTGRLPWNYRAEPGSLGQAKLMIGTNFIDVVQKAERAYKDPEFSDFLGLWGLGEVLEQAAIDLLRGGTDMETVIKTSGMARSAYEGASVAYIGQTLIPDFDSMLRGRLQRIEGFLSGSSPITATATLK